MEKYCMKEQAKQWLEFSKIDLATIEKIKNDEFLTQSAAFHSQQSVEKSLKSILELYDFSVPKSHDLRMIYTKIEKLKINLEIDNDMLDSINQIYIDTRYPADFGLLPGGKPSLKMIDKFYEYAKSIYAMAEEIINKFE